MIETAHHVGLSTTATIMWGHCDGPQHWAQHLRLLRELQGRTWGITEFVPLPFVHMEAPIYLKGAAPPLHCCSPCLVVPAGCSGVCPASPGRDSCGALRTAQRACPAGRARRGPTLRECMLMHAIARLALAGYIDNIQVHTGWCCRALSPWAAS